MWLASRESHRLYAIDPITWQVIHEFSAPGAPFGIAARGGELRVIVGFGEDDDDRYIYRFVTALGFAPERIPCPDLSGVHLALDDEVLYLSQAHNRRILALDEHGAIAREIPLTCRPVGMTRSAGVFYLVTGEPGTQSTQVTTVDARGEKPLIQSRASIPFVARGLAFDGACWWTADRENNEIVRFTLAP